MSGFDEIETGLSRLMAASDPAFTTSERAEIQHFIDVGEYGIALETAVGIFAEEHKVATAEIRRLIGKLAELMELDATDLLSRLDEPA
jgi:hypothetical protein